MDATAEAKSPSPTESPLFVSMMSGKTDRLKKALAAYWAAESAWKIGKKWYQRAQSEVTFTVAIAGDDDIYPEVHRWLLEKLPPARRRALVVKTRRRGDSEMAMPVDSPSVPSPNELKMFYDGTRPQTVDLAGHKVEVSLERPSWAQGVRFTESEERRLGQLERVVFKTRGEDGRNAVIGFLTEIAQRQVSQPPRLYVGSRYGGWHRMADVPPRPLDSVVLDPGQKELLIGDLRQFLSAERAYGELGVPWHRGYLFEGPPGTGKTSLAKAIAGHFHLDVHYIPLSVIEDDSSLTQLFTNISGRSVLLLEDIDVVHGARERDDSKTGVTLTGLLNALDGFITPHGLVTVMTTNDASVIDDALLRPGRVDRREYVGFLTDEQLDCLLDTFVMRGETFIPRSWVGQWGVSVDGRGIAPAAVIEIVKRHLGDRDAVLAEVKALVCT